MIVFSQSSIDSLSEDERAQLEALAAKAGETAEEPETADELIARRLDELKREEAENRRFREELEASLI